MVQKLSEQLVMEDWVTGLTGTASASGSTSATGAAVDMRDHHQILVVAHGERAASSTSAVTGVNPAATTATVAISLTIQVQASTSTGFTAPTTITTSTLTATASATAAATGTAGTTVTATTSVSTNLEVNIRGEAVQGARVAEDRYIRAIVTLGGAAAGVANGVGYVLANQSRYKPSA